MIILKESTCAKEYKTEIDFDDVKYLSIYRFLCPTKIKKVEDMTQFTVLATIKIDGCKQADNLKKILLWIDNPNWFAINEADSFIFCIGGIESYIHCEPNEITLFLELAKMRNDIDKGQWFIWDDGDITKCVKNTEIEMWGENGTNGRFRRRATPMEVYKYLKIK